MQEAGEGKAKRFTYIVYVLRSVIIMPHKWDLQRHLFHNNQPDFLSQDR